MSEAPLISVQKISKSFSARPLFKNLSLGIFPKEKTGLIGLNGTGKSTLLKILAGFVEPDEGERSAQKKLRFGFVAQLDQIDPNTLSEKTIDELTVLEALLYFLKKYSNKSTPKNNKTETNELDTTLEIQASKAMTLLKQPENKLYCKLSGGEKKKVSIISQLILAPDLLFLDEPTNHLDFESIAWLEKQLRNFKGSIFLISHDRSFLEKICNRIIELHPRYNDGLLKITGNYSTFLQEREMHLDAIAHQEASLVNRNRREIQWLRQGVKARTTKSKSRIERAYDLQDQVQDLKERGRSEQAKINFTASSRKAKKLLAVNDLSFTFEGSSTPLFSNITLSLTSKSRIGLVGPNGCGKSTFLKTISNQLHDNFGKLAGNITGDIQKSEDLKIVYFEQGKTSLDLNKSVKENLNPDSDYVLFQGRSIHIASYAKRFLFESHVLNLPINRLSGGEQSRLLIAKLMLREADLLLLDEPTNDLDIETMEILADSISSFNGAVIIISHDRYFLEQVTEGVFDLSPNAGIDSSTKTLDETQNHFFADLFQWEAYKADQLAKVKASEKIIQLAEKKDNTKTKKRLSYNDKREWEQMEEKILVAEESLEKWKLAVEEQTNNVTIPEELQKTFAGMSSAQKLVDQLYARWAELEDKQS